LPTTGYNRWRLTARDPPRLRRIARVKGKCAPCEKARDAFDRDPKKTDYLFAFVLVVAFVFVFAFVFVLAGFVVIFDVVVFDVVVVVVLVVVIGVDVFAGVIVLRFAFAFVFDLLALFAPESPQAIPRAPKARRAESAIIFFITIKSLLSSTKN
jgi:hypothetical protein